MAYLDHAAATPVRAGALEAFAAASAAGNASSVHGPGRRARRSVEEARERIAEAVGADPMEVLFTSGGTESVNLAVKGHFWARTAEDPGRRRIVVSPTEHHAVLEAVSWLVRYQGAQVTWLAVDADGRMAPEAMSEALAADGGPDTVALAAVMWANNEVGTLQPIPDLAQRCADVPLFSDAVQALPYVPVDAGCVATLALSGHKVGAPGGTGALVARRDCALQPLLHGGGQERGLRSGSVNVAGAVALAAAVSEAVEIRKAESARLARLADGLRQAICDAAPDATLNGPDRPEDRLPGLVHASFPGCDGDALLMLLDAGGVAVSTGSACAAGVAEPSHVLLAMGRTPRQAGSSLRFSLGHTSTWADVAAVRAVLPEAVARARAAGAVRAGAGT